MIAGHIDDLRALAPLAQELLDDVVMRLRPVPASLQPPAVDDVADQIDLLGLVLAQKVDQQTRLASRGAKMDVGQEQRTEMFRFHDGHLCRLISVSRFAIAANSRNTPCDGCAFCRTKRLTGRRNARRLACKMNGRTAMDLGIAGKKAIVCASSRGLGKGCALALAEAGCDVVVNGRNEEVLERNGRRNRRQDRRQGHAGHRRRLDRRGPGGAARRLPRARHPGQQQWRPALQRFPRARPRRDARRASSRTW